MVNYYTDSARKSLWVLSNPMDGNYKSIICFAAEEDSGFHVGQRANNPKLDNSNWQPLEGEISISDILYV